MTYRLYFWFHGADAGRAGGPWWYRDFITIDQRARFLNDITRFLHTHRLVEGDPLPVHGPMDIHPPEGGLVEGRPATCRKCGTNIDEDGFCRDETCPYSNHWQHSKYTED